MPAGLVEQDDAMSRWFDCLGDFRQVEGHGLCVAAGQHQARALAFLGADGPENVDRAGALIVRRTWPRATLGPPAGDLVLLADPVKRMRFTILKSDLYVLALGLFSCDLRQRGREVFLKAAMASASWA